jgi:hypothetical protein
MRQLRLFSQKLLRGGAIPAYDNDTRRVSTSRSALSGLEICPVSRNFVEGAKLGTGVDARREAWAQLVPVHTRLMTCDEFVVLHVFVSDKTTF